MIWFNDPVGFLFNENNWFRLIPVADATVEDQMNAVFMFALYFTIGVLVIKRDIRIIYVFLVVCLLTWLFYRHHKMEQFDTKAMEDKANVKKNLYRNEYCVKPSKDNPFMNLSLKDMNEFPTRPKACNLSRSDVSAEAQKYFDEGLPRQLDDVFRKNASDRQFFTMPSTTLPNDIDNFKSFVYKIPPTLKQAGQNF
jgi:hypothetical protein